MCVADKRALVSDVIIRCRRMQYIVTSRPPAEKLSRAQTERSVAQSMSLLPAEPRNAGRGRSGEVGVARCQLKRENRFHIVIGAELTSDQLTGSSLQQVVPSPACTTHSHFLSCIPTEQ